MTVIVVAAIGVVINGVCAGLFASGRKGDLNIRGAFMHMAADALVSVGVVIAGVAILLTGWLWLDPAVSLIVNVIIIGGTWSSCATAWRCRSTGFPPACNCRRLARFSRRRPAFRASTTSTSGQ